MRVINTDTYYPVWLEENKTCEEKKNVFDRTEKKFLREKNNRVTYPKESRGAGHLHCSNDGPDAQVTQKLHVGDQCCDQGPHLCFI